MFIYQFIIFIIVALAILFSAHYFLYFSTFKFFNITSASQKYFLLGALAFLAVSFILSSFLIRWQENSVTRVFYFASGFWLGLLNNLVLTAAFVWIIVWLAKIFGFNINLGILGAAFLVLALAVSFYGVWNAFNPQIKNISVTIPNLSENWKGKKIVQLSDIHLGHIYQENFLQNVVDKVNSVNPDLVLITGDLFDGMDGNLGAFVGPLNAVQPKNGIYFVTGNHETYLGVDKAFAALKKTKVNILNDSVADADGLKLIGISYPEREKNRDEATVLQSMQKDFFGQPNILLHHAPTNMAEFEKLGINLQLSGHTHKGQVFPFGFITSLIYKGYDYGLHKIGKLVLYTTDGAGTWGPTMRVGNIPEIPVITLK